MTNFEKYRDEIMEMPLNRETFCHEFVIPNILSPRGYDCNVPCGICNMFFTAWLMDEYEESELQKSKVDWNKVPVDTKIYVKECSYGDWSPRYFAKYENGKVYAWSAGGTSWSCGEDDVTFWEYVVLAEEESL